MQIKTEQVQPATKSSWPRPRPRPPRRRIGIGGVAFLLLLLTASTATGYYGYQQYGRPKAVVEQTTTSAVRRGNIAASINVSGSTAAKSQAKLAFESGGLLTKLTVKVGDGVKAGDVVANLDTADLLLQVAQAEVSLEQAKVKLAQLKEGPKDVEVAAVRASYDSAVNKYNELKASPKAEEVSAAEVAVKDAEVNLANARSNLVVTQKGDTVSKNPRDRDNEHNWYEAKYGDTLTKFRGGQASQADVDRDWANLLTAKEKVDSARAQADLALRRAENDVTKAEQAVTNAKQSLEKILAGPTSDQLKAAEASMLNAQSQLEAKTAGPSATDVSTQEVAIRLAEAALKQKQLLVEKATLRAPFDGVIDSIAINQGEQVSASKEVMTLVNMKQFQINARVDETQVASLAVGQTATITMDALPEQRLTGKVASIGATAAVSQGVVNYPVVLELQATEAPVRPGMTANAVVEVARRDNALLVPNRAIKTQGRNRIVTVVTDGQQETRVVTTGMSNDQSTEITNGLKEGDQVVIPTTTTTTPRVPGIQGGMQGGPGGAQGGFAAPILIR